jgi:hypothetical protein
MASILYEVAEGKASQKQKNILLYRTIKKDWADGFAAPDGHCFALTTGAWITLRVTHNSTSPSNNEDIISGRNERELPRGLQGSSGNHRFSGVPRQTK